MPERCWERIVWEEGWTAQLLGLRINTGSPWGGLLTGSVTEDMAGGREREREWVHYRCGLVSKWIIHCFDHIKKQKCSDYTSLNISQVREQAISQSLLLRSWEELSGLERKFVGSWNIGLALNLTSLNASFIFLGNLSFLYSHTKLDRDNSVPWEINEKTYTDEN